MDFAVSPQWEPVSAGEVTIFPGKKQLVVTTLSLRKMRPQSKQGAELEGEPEIKANHPQRHCFELQKVTDVPAVTYTQRYTSGL